MPCRAPQAGGLYVLGTTRHESRRIDNQLRGRAGRQARTGTDGERGVTEVMRSNESRPAVWRIPDHMCNDHMCHFLQEESREV